MTPKASIALAAALTLAACASAPAETGRMAMPPQDMAAAEAARFEKDRQAILAMAGDYDVTFDFEETVPLAAGYELKEPKLSGAHEVVRVIEDNGDFISLQHILVVGGEQKFPVKHWRQDWVYEPETVLVFKGGNAWEVVEVPEAEREGAWSQTVYQVDDSPRYGAVGGWTHGPVTAWTPESEWRPLPRRDMTTRDDYHAVDAVNRHALTPFGWVHEQDNTKLVLSGDSPAALVREVGVNSYRRNGEFEVAVAEEYWAATEDYWAEVRDAWRALEVPGTAFAITAKGETEAVYQPLLGLAEAVKEGELTVEAAGREARAVIAKFTTRELAPLADRLRTSEEAYAAIR